MFNILKDNCEIIESQIAFLYEKGNAFDCNFIIGEASNQIRLPAHKYMLTSSSIEFNFLLKEDQNEIIILDVAPSAVVSFLLFIYKNYTELNHEIIWDVIKLSSKFCMENLEKICEEFLLQNKSIDDENVFEILDKILNYNLPILELKIMSFISRSTVSILDSEAFNTIDKETLIKLLKFEKLPGRENEIYKAVSRWSTNYCLLNNIQPTFDNRRNALGEALKLIRFGAMTYIEFRECTDGNPVITLQEIFEIFQCIESKGQIKCKFSSIERRNNTFGSMNEIVSFTTATPPSSPSSPISKTSKNRNLVKICHLFDKVDPGKRKWPGYDIISFSVNKPIYFFGLGIYGRTRSNGQLDIHNPQNFIIQLEDASYNLLDENIVSIRHDGTSKIYQLLLKDSILLEANKYYLRIKRQKRIEFENFVGLKTRKEIFVDDVLFKIHITYYNIFAAIVFKEC